jgi:indole-3-glycerol phosphate synthase
VSDILSRICADKRRHVKRRKQRRPLGELSELARGATRPRGFAAALEAALASGYGLIAEIKRASPSKGLIRADFNPVALAQAYEGGGAACLSVLTDVPYFQGADEYLVAARAAVGLPVLRKDFFLDPYQVVEARVLGADCVLLIMAAIDDAEAREMENAALEFGMDILVEVHDEAEMERALGLEAQLIGINNRDLKSLAVDLATTERLAPMVPSERILVSESGLSQPDDLARMAKAGAHCFLIGEALMRAADVEQATREVLRAPVAETVEA